MPFQLPGSTCSHRCERGPDLEPNSILPGRYALWQIDQITETNTLSDSRT